jgi:hypothetical protein
MRSRTSGGDMKVKAFLFLCPTLIGLYVAVSGVQSSREFVDRADNFKIVLAGNWRPVSFINAVGRQKTEFIGQDRRSGLLRVTKETLRGRSLSEIVRGEGEDARSCYTLISIGHEEFIGGSLSGIRVTLHYVEDYRQTIGTYYFLRDGDSVWTLRFTGQPGSSDMALEVTDKLARSFCSECPIF